MSRSLTNDLFLSKNWNLIRTASALKKSQRLKQNTKSMICQLWVSCTWILRNKKKERKTAILSFSLFLIAHFVLIIHRLTYYKFSGLYACFSDHFLGIPSFLNGRRLVFSWLVLTFFLFDPSIPPLFLSNTICRLKRSVPDFFYVCEQLLYFDWVRKQTLPIDVSRVSSSFWHFYYPDLIYFDFDCLSMALEKIMCFCCLLPNNKPPFIILFYHFI